MKPHKFKGDLTFKERLKLLEDMRISIKENIDRMNGYIKNFNGTILKFKGEMKKKR